MGAPITEFVLETVIRDGIGELRNNPAKLDDLFSRFTQAQFINQYGQTQIDRLKTYIQENQLRIVQGFAMVPMSVPCYSIQMVRAEEREDEQQFSNLFEETEESKTAEIYVDPATPVSYDTATGKLVLDPATDLSTICPGLTFVDASQNHFTVQTGISNLSGDKFINIGTGKEPDLTGPGLIISPIDFTRTERRMVRLRETISIGCHSKDDLHLSKYLYYILYYILKSRQESLIKRGIYLDREIGGMFERADNFGGENVFSRYIEINCLTEFDWDQAEVQVFDCFDLTIKGEKKDKTKFDINTSDDC